MTHYSDNPGMVRVDFFKESGKWYMTEAHDMSNYWDHRITPADAVRAMLRDEGRLLEHFNIVVLEPYHKLAYPVFLPAEASA